MTCKEVNYYSVKKMKSNFKEMNDMRREHILCDLNIKIGSKIVSIHKIVLASSSKYFKKMFTGSVTKSNVEEITMDEMIAPNAFEVLIDYMYTSNLKITEYNVLDLLVASKYLLLFDIYEACKKFLKEITNVKNCLLFQSFAHRNNESELQEFYLQFIFDNFLEVVKSEHYLKLTFDQIKKIIESDHLYAKEEKIYEAVILWVNHDEKNRSILLPELLQLVRLPSIPMKYLIGINNEQKLIKSNSKCMEILDNAIKIQICIRDGIRNQPPSICNYNPRAPQVFIILHCKKSKSSTLQWYNVLKKKLHLTTLTWNDPMNTSIILNNGRIFHLELNQERTNTFSKIFNGDSKQWESTSFSHFNHDHYPKIVQFEDRVYVFSIIGVEYYDILNKSWYKVNFQLPISGMFYMKLAVVSNQIYIISEEKCMCYDPKTDVGRLIHSISRKKCEFALCSLNNQLYLNGGLVESDDEYSDCTEDVEKYDSESDTWIIINQMNTWRYSSGAIAINGLMYVIGCGKLNCNKQNSKYSIEYYDPKTNQWCDCENKIILPSNYSYSQATAFVLGVESNIRQDNILNYYSKNSN